MITKLLRKLLTKEVVLMIVEGAAIGTTIYILMKVGGFEWITKLIK